jgi:hypothetical protein
LGWDIGVAADRRRTRRTYRHRASLSPKPAHKECKASDQQDQKHQQKNATLSAVALVRGPVVGALNSVNDCDQGLTVRVDLFGQLLEQIDRGLAV